MMNIITNQNFPLEFSGYQNESGIGWLMYIQEAEEAVIPNVLRRSKTMQWTIVGMAWLFVIIGTYFRSVFYEYVIERYKSKEFTPINSLTLIVNINHHLGIIIVTSTTTTIVFNEGSLTSYAWGTWICTGQRYLHQYYLMYSFIGGLGVSLYRILLIKHALWVNHLVGEVALKNIILFGGLFLTSLFVMLMNSNDYEPVMRSTCMMVPKALVLQKLDEYNQSRGYLGTLSYFHMVRIFVMVCRMIITIAEVIIYVVFFHHMYKNDNKDSLRRLLGSQAINQRNKRNAVTFFGHFCTFIFEFTTLLIFIVALSIGSPHWKRGNVFISVALLSWQFFFAIMSLVEVMTSNVLSSRLSKKMYLGNIIFESN